MIFRGCLLLVAVTLAAVPVSAQGDGVPLDADLPLVFMRTLDPALVEVLKGLQPTIPPEALQPDARQQAATSVAPLGAPTSGLVVGPGLAISRPDVDPLDLPDLGLPAPVASLQITPSRPGEGSRLDPVTRRQPGQAPSGETSAVHAQVAPATGGPAALDDRLSKALARLRAGDASPDVIAQVRSLPREDLLSLIAGTPNTWQNEGLVDVLTTILLEQHGFGAESTCGIDDRLLARLGISLARMGKPDAVPILEGLLARRDGLAEGSVPELAGLAVYYRAIGQVGKAAETLLRIDAYSASVPVRANTRVDAARIYLLSGDQAAASRTYAQVAAFGYGWATGMAVYDQAREAIQQGRYADAREILATPVEGEYAEQTRVALVNLQGEAFRREGDVTQAVASYRRALELYDALEAPLPNEGLEAIVASSRRRLAAIEREPAKD